MQGSPHKPATYRYLVELRRSDAGWEAVEGLAARARLTAGELRREGTPVRFLRTIFVPEDETCFLLYEGPSVEAVREATRRAAIPTEHIVEAVPAQAGQSERAARKEES